MHAARSRTCERRRALPEAAPSLDRKYPRQAVKKLEQKGVTNETSSPFRFCRLPSARRPANRSGCPSAGPHGSGGRLRHENGRCLGAARRTRREPGRDAAWGGIRENGVPGVKIRSFPRPGERKFRAPESCPHFKTLRMAHAALGERRATKNAVRSGKASRPPTERFRWPGLPGRCRLRSSVAGPRPHDGLAPVYSQTVLLRTTP